MPKLMSKFIHGHWIQTDSLGMCASGVLFSRFLLLGISRDDFFPRMTQTGKSQNIRFIITAKLDFMHLPIF